MSTAKLSKQKSIAITTTDDEADSGDEGDRESNLPKCM